MSSALYDERLSPERWEIRTLTLKRGEFAQPVHCDLTTVSLNNCPSYIALSYVWGNTNHRLPIYINGIEVSATENLAVALQYIRKVDRDQVLWVDAVCINQNDMEERNSQVRLMGKLYSEAEDVFIWLGEPDDITDDFAHFIQESGIPLGPEEDAENFQEEYRTYIIQINAIKALFQIIALRPWWRRVWTVQECVLPKNDPIFQCGFSTFSWELFFSRFLDLCTEIGSVARLITRTDHSSENDELARLRDRLSKGTTNNEMLQIFQAIGSLASLRLVFQATSRIPLVDCFALCVGRQASVAQDYIYGFLGLAAEEDSQRVSIDYSRPYWETYRNFYELLIDVAGPRAFQVFLVCSFNDCDEQPSWMPDFSIPKDLAERTGYFLASDECFGEFKEVSRSKDGKGLRIRGVLLDTVDHIHPMPRRTSNLVECVLNWAEEIEVSGRSSIVGNNGPPVQLVEACKQSHISRLFFGNNRLNEEYQITESEIETCWDLIMAHYQGKGTLHNFGSSDFQRARPELGGGSVLNVIHENLTQIFDVPTETSVIRTRSGILGICFSKVQPLDEIICLYGCHMPLILRPRNNYYRLIGGIHMPGLMDWKAIAHCVASGDFGEATFVIQ